MEPTDERTVARAHAWHGVLVALPGFLFAMACLVLPVADAFGVSPLWPDERLTLSEAVAARDLGALNELVGKGADFEQSYRVRGGYLWEQDKMLTPFEVALAASREDVIEWLRARGIEPAPGARPRLACLAVITNKPAVASAWDPSASAQTCEGIERPW